MGSIESYYPLTPVQQGMLFHCLQRPDEGEYWQQLIVRLSGQVDPDLLSEAFSWVADRHPALRTSLMWEGVPEPVQVVHNSVHVPLTVHDWGSADEKEKRQMLDRLLDDDRVAGCNLSEPPLWRLHMIKWQDQDWQLVWGHHHVLLDGWSLPIVVSDLLGCYRALKSGKPIELPDVRPYKDYVAYLRKRDKAAEEQFWQQLLSGFNRATPIGFARSAPAGDRTGQAVVEVSFTPDETDMILTAARTARLTINTLVQASWAILLGRYAGDDQVLMGIVTAGRPPELSGMDSIVGLFVNTVPFPVNLNRSLRVRDLLMAVQLQMMDVQAHGLAPLVDIARWSEMPRGESLLESILVFGSTRLSSATSDKIIRVVEVDAVERTHYPLTLLARVMPHLSFRARYDQALFDERAVAQAMEQLKRILLKIACEPDCVLGDICLCTDDDQQVIATWSCNTGDFPEGKTVVDLVGARVERWPDRIAVQHGDQHVTYRELDQCSDRLANRLIELGTTGQVVAVSVPRSIELIVALWGIIKSGAAYLPLDPDWPVARLRVMLNQAEVSVGVVSGQVPEVLSEGYVVVDVSDDSDLGKCDPPDVAPSPDDLCYVIFTSGSTGKPKGVAMPHRSLVNLFNWQELHSGLPESRATLQYTSVGFDVSSQEIFCTLATGGRLVIIDEHDRRDPVKTLELILQYEVDRLFVPFVALDAIATVAGAGVSVPDCLNQIITAGEQLKITPAIARMMTSLPGCVLQNQYGPAETHVVTAHTMTGSATDWPLLPPIGKPISNVRTTIVDGAGQMAPLGMAGELLIGGVAVAKGYIGDPGRTQKRFIVEPVAGEGVVYRTGDICRWNERGEIEFVGRSDDQIKIRGYRVEPGEVEAVMRSLPGVSAAAVIADRSTSMVRLLGYCVLEDQSLTGDLIKDSLKATLPDYMIPVVITVMDALPLTASGKVDRRSLPVPRPVSVVSGGVPGSGMQKQIADIWRELLAVNDVGLDDNFFDLGGHSLLAIQVYSRLRAITDKEFSIVDLFDHSTIRELAAFLEDKVTGPPEQSADRAEARRQALNRVRRRRSFGEGGEHGS